MKYPIEQIMYGSFIKYERMAQLTQESFGKNPFCCNATNLHVYIDMNSLIKTLYISNDLTIEDYTVITSSIINSSTNSFILFFFTINFSFFKIIEPLSSTKPIPI